MNDAIDTALAFAEEHVGDYTQDLMDFVTIPSVSTDPEHEQDIGAAAVWAAARLQRAGVPEVRAIDTPGHPVVVGRWQVDAGRPTVVIYGHYDVQPPDNLELWETPPFEPEVRDGKVFGRGASASKGSVLVPIQAVEAWSETAGAPPVNVTFVLEGEEVSLSPHLPTFLREHKELLDGDLAISADGAMFGPDEPSLTVASRGNCACEVVVQGAAVDLHSGAYGGAVPNTPLALAHMLARLHDHNGRVAVPGFYDGVEEPSQAIRDAIRSIPFDDAQERAALGLRAWTGEAGYSPQERMWVRPTLDVTGMGGGFQGDGIKTVLPSEARAKISCRLVPGQDPERILGAIETFLHDRAPEGVTVHITRLPGIARAYAMPLEHPALGAAARSIEAVYGKRPFPMWMGATVPAAEAFTSALGMWCLYFAFAEFDNRQHAPNEFYRIDTLRRGTAATVRLLAALQDTPLR